MAFVTRAPGPATHNRGSDKTSSGASSKSGCVSSALRISWAGAWGLLDRRCTPSCGGSGWIDCVSYEWPGPGDLLHLDIRKLGRIGQGGGKRFGKNRSARGLGWERVHIAIDDYSCLAHAEVCPDELATATVAFTKRGICFFAAAGIDVRRILSDNGSAYRSRLFADLLTEHGISMRKTRPYRPQTNAKAEAFVKIVTNEWAYARAY